MAHSGHIEFVAEIKGVELVLDVYATVSSGGSTSWGSDEPPWFDADIDDIRWCGRKISNRLWGKLFDLYEDEINEKFQSKYY
jgi:hypothetical protein